MENPAVLRVCLYEDGTFSAIPWNGSPDEGDYADEPIEPGEALKLMTSGQVPIEIACKDPGDTSIHNYETLTPKNVTLSYV